MINNTRRIDDLRIPPQNRLEKLSGNRDGQWSIRINDQWRVCFMWREGNAERVEICDYHWEVTMMERLPNIHLGEVLREEFLIPFGLSQYRLAKAIGVPEARISAICAGKRAITADTALRLSRFFGTSASFWLGLQADYDLEEAVRVAGDALSRIERFRSEPSHA